MAYAGPIRVNLMTMLGILGKILFLLLADVTEKACRPGIHWLLSWTQIYEVNPVGGRAEK